MLILLISQYDNAGVGHRLMLALNKHGKNCTCRHIVFYEHHNKYPIDILVCEKNRKKIRQLLSEASIIQFNHSVYFNSILGMEIPNNKVKAIYHTGRYYRKCTKGCIDRDNYMHIIFLGEPFLKFDSRGIALPSPIDTTKYKPIVRKERKKIYIGHSPSSKLRKGTKYFIEATDRLKDEGFNIKPVLIAGVSHNRAMKLKSICDIFFDALSVNCAIYGQSTVEAACFGIPVLARKDECVFENPLINVTPETLYDEMKRLVIDEEERKRIGKETRKWVVAKHGERAVVRKMMKAFHNAMRGRKKK